MERKGSELLDWFIAGIRTYTSPEPMPSAEETYELRKKIIGYIEAGQTQTPTRHVLKHTYDLLSEMSQQGAIRSDYVTAVNDAMRELFDALKGYEITSSNKLILLYCYKFIVLHGF